MKKIALSLTVAALVASVSLTGCGNANITSADDHSGSHNTEIQAPIPQEVNSTQETNTTQSGTTVESNSTLEVPTFAGNSQGKIVVQCEDDIVYYIMAYDCLKADTKPTVTVDNGDLTVDEAYMHVGEVFYTSGHVDRMDTDPVTITGHVFSGGKDLPTNPAWVATCK